MTLILLRGQDEGPRAGSLKTFGYSRSGRYGAGEPDLRGWWPPERL
jgi:hypothetical protein